ncbi:MAG TPA: hypothetical protein VF546_11890 [Pyrinomonadaceae bacterium]|jgi:hypothetical protein
MCRNSLSLLLALSLVLTCAPLCARAQQTPPAAAAQTPAQSAPPSQTPLPLDKQSQRIKRVVTKVGVGERLTVFLNNGEELHGTVTQIGADSFALAEVDRHDLFTILYRDVRKARSGYEGVSLFTGKHVSSPRGLKIALAAGALFAAIGLPLIILASSKD